MAATPPDRVVHLPGTNADYEALFVDFEVGSSELQPEHEAWLQALGKRLLREETRVGLSLWGIAAVGYASQTGSKKVNAALSVARAEAAVDSYAGLMHRPLAMKPRFLGLGSDYPVDPKIAENGRDRCVHFAAGIVETLLPASPKTVDLDLVKLLREENARRHKVTVTVDGVSETGVGVSKFLAGVGYSTLRIHFTVRQEGRGVGKKYTFVGGGFGVGLSLNPLPVDVMRSVGEGKPTEIYIHDSLDDEKHFLGKATVDQIGEGVYLSYRGRHDVHRLSLELKMPTQVQAPSLNLGKRFNGSVRAGHLR